MRTVCPASSRFFGSARLPLTRNSPLRITRWIWEKSGREIALRESDRPACRFRPPSRRRSAPWSAAACGGVTAFLVILRWRAAGRGLRTDAAADRDGCRSASTRRVRLRHCLRSRAARGFDRGFGCRRLSRGRRSAPARRGRRTAALPAAVRRDAAARPICLPPPGCRGPRLLLTPLRSPRSLAQLRPVVEPLPDLALEAALRRIVELLPAERFREIVLAGKRLRRVVVVFVARAVAFASSSAWSAR